MYRDNAHSLAYMYFCYLFFAKFLSKLNTKLNNFKKYIF